MTEEELKAKYEEIKAKYPNIKELNRTELRNLRDELYQVMLAREPDLDPIGQEMVKLFGQIIEIDNSELVSDH